MSTELDPNLDDLSRLRICTTYFFKREENSAGKKECNL